jgi:hypothetical protein
MRVRRSGLRLLFNTFGGIRRDGVRVGLPSSGRILIGGFCTVGLLFSGSFSSGRYVWKCGIRGVL